MWFLHGQMLDLASKQTTTRHKNTKFISQLHGVFCGGDSDVKTYISCTPMMFFFMGRKVISMTHVGRCTIHASYRNTSLNTNNMQIHICRCPICLRGFEKQTPGPTKCGRYSPTPSEKFLIPSTTLDFSSARVGISLHGYLQVDQTSAVSTCTSQKVYHLVHRDPYPVFNIIPIKLGSTITQIQRCGHSTFGNTTLHGRWKIIQPCVQDGPKA